MKTTDNNITNSIAGQMLYIMEACAITGLSKSCITSKIHSGKLYAALVARRFMIPGIILLEYMKSSDYKWTKEKSDCYKPTAKRKESGKND